MNKQSMPIAKHLVELRRRMVWCIIVYFALWGLCWLARKPIFCAFTLPLQYVLPHGHHLIFTGLSEAFITQLKMTGLTALLLGWPLWMHQLWLFLSPALLKSEAKSVRCMLILSPFLFLMGAAFAYIIVCPSAYAFFASFEVNDSPIPLHMEARISEYLSLTWRLVASFGLGFQMPLIIFGLAALKIVSKDQLQKSMRPAFASIFVIAAVITPPDILSMLALAVPLCGLYTLTVWTIRES